MAQSGRALRQCHHHGHPMTACLYISPRNHPALIADAMVTGGASRAPLILPSTFTEAIPASDLQRVRLARKIYILDKNTAICVAGLEKDIRSFLEVFQGLDSTSWNPDRPLKPMSDHVNEYKGNVESIGIHIPSGDLSGVFHKFYPSKNGFELPIYGHCATIGSGARFLRELVQRYSKNAAGLDATLVAGGPLELVRGTAGAITNKFLADEIVRSEGRNFGGYAEYSYFDPLSKCWTFGPSCLNLFYIAQRKSEDTFDLSQIGRVIAYNPSIPHGRILAVCANNSGADVLDLLLENILEPGGVEPSTQFWHDWRPESCTTTIVADWKRIGGMMARTTDLNQANEIRFHFDGTRIEARLSPEYVSALGHEAGSAWGMRYVQGRVG
jgi:hypothetical protein